MTWFSKTAVFCATLMLLGYTLEILGYTIHSCSKKCKNEADDHLCARKMYKLDNGNMAPDYIWLRNECERKCVMYGEYERVEMERCTESGQNYTTYRCTNSKGHPELFRRCLRKESMRNESKTQ